MAELRRAWGRGGGLLPGGGGGGAGVLVAAANFAAVGEHGVDEIIRSQRSRENSPQKKIHAGAAKTKATLVLGGQRRRNEPDWEHHRAGGQPGSAARDGSWIGGADLCRSSVQYRQAA